MAKVLSTLAAHGVMLNVQKCKWFAKEVEFLGHVVSEEGLKKPESYVKSVLEFPRPTTKKKLREFLGLVNFQRKFIPRCSLIMKPLSQATGGRGKNVEVIWTEEMKTAFDALKEAMATATVLTFPDFSDEAEPFSLFTDASGVGIGACLSQLQDGCLKPITFASVAFNAAESNYCTLEKELSAIRWAVKTFRPFLFGVSFVIHTDHRPLVYLYNMQIVNARLARTLQELAEYDFVIVYTPGKDNVVADALSRGINVPEKESETTRLDGVLPSGLLLVNQVPGGGNSLVESLLEAGKHARLPVPLPASGEMLRQLLVKELLRQPELYLLTKTKKLTRELRLMEHHGQLLCPEAIGAFAQLFKCIVFVHHGCDIPVVHTSQQQQLNEDAVPRVHLQCLSGVHYNPVVETAGYIVPRIPREPVIRPQFDHRDEMDQKYTCNEEMEVLSEDLDEDMNLGLIGKSENLASEHPVDYWCLQHGHTHDASTVTEFEGRRCCVLIDTGAQVSCVLEEIFRRSDAELDSTRQYHITGIGKKSSQILGSVELKLVLDNFELEHHFAVVPNDSMQFCFIIGADIITKYSLCLELHSNKCFHLDGAIVLQQRLQHTNTTSHMMMVDCGVIIGRDVDADTLFRGGMSGEDVLQLQKSNSQLRQLHNVMGQDVNRWPKVLKKFRQVAQKIESSNGILMFAENDIVVPVVPFKFLVEVLIALHFKGGHAGRQKLITHGRSYVWHPSLSSVAADITRSCAHCQKVKVASLPRPPITKIKTSQPFQMVGVDLIALPRTRRGNVCCLVAVDHNSKWMSVVPLSSKTGTAVAGAMKSRVLTSFARVPDRILSDNGPEFISREFNAVLESFSIDHMYTTPYRPASNGLVERANRTLAELLRNEDAERSTWDEFLPKIVINYNNSFHSELGMSPSEYLLKNPHNVMPGASLPAGETALWREGNPSFVPFRRGQQVLRKTMMKGNNVADKLTERFRGPYKIIVAHANRLTYVIKSEEDGSQQRAHYSQLRRFYKPPAYIVSHSAYKRMICVDSEDQMSEEDTMEVEPDDDRGGGDFGYLPRCGILSGYGRESESTSDSDLNTVDSADTCDSVEYISTDSDSSSDTDNGKLNYRKKRWSHRSNQNRTAKYRNELANQLLEQLDCADVEVVELPVHDEVSLSIIGQNSQFWTVDDEVISDIEAAIFEKDSSKPNFNSRDEYTRLLSSPSTRHASSSPLEHVSSQTFLEAIDPEERKRLCGSLDRMMQVLDVKNSSKGVLWLSGYLAALDLASTFNVNSRLRGGLQQYRSMMDQPGNAGDEVNHADQILQRSQNEISSPYQQQNRGSLGNIGRNTHSMTTRSKGPVASYPHVQPRVLEYKHSGSPCSCTSAPSGEECNGQAIAI